MRFQKMSARVTTRLVVIGACAIAPALSADETIGIPEIVPFSETVNVPAAVRSECQLGEKVSTFLKQYARDVRFAEPGVGRYLDMSITEVHAPGGGSWSGPKWMAVSGTLTNGDEPTLSFRAKRFTTGGAFAEFKGTCSIIGRSAKAIAKDISRWLKRPVDGAALGDAR